MCSCGENCVDARAEKASDTYGRTPEFATFKDSGGSFTGFVMEAPLGTDDLMYAQSEERPGVWLEPGRWYRYSELTPEQQAIYDEGHRQGREDALNLAQAITKEYADDVGKDEPVAWATLDDLGDLGDELDVLADEVADLATAVAEGFTLIHEILRVHLQAINALEANACPCG